MTAQTTGQNVLDRVLEPEAVCLREALDVADYEAFPETRTETPSLGRGIWAVRPMRAG